MSINPLRNPVLLLFRDRLEPFHIRQRVRAKFLYDTWFLFVNENDSMRSIQAGRVGTVQQRVGIFDGHGTRRAKAELWEVSIQGSASIGDRVTPREDVHVRLGPVPEYRGKLFGKTDLALPAAEQQVG